MDAETQSPPATVEALLRAGVRLLAATSRTPRLDAELLLANALGCSRTRLFTARDESVRTAAGERFRALLAERRAGRPVAQLTGRREFWSLDLAVTPDVLTPRPETELLVERALARIAGHRSPRVLDLGTGSGAVALAIAAERGDAALLATDASPAALAVARVNASALGLAQLDFACGDWFAAAGTGQFDLIVSNPPYVADDEWAGSDPELAFEPRAALAAGPDGLDALRVIVAGAPAHLAPGGWLVLEHGASQGGAVRDLVRRAGLGSVATTADLAGLPRVTEGRLGDRA
jgi:release factor glutamine methyltransferase